MTRVFATALVLASLALPTSASEAVVPLPHHRPAASELTPPTPASTAVSSDAGEDGQVAPEFDPAQMRAECEATLKAEGVMANWIGRAEKDSCVFDQAVELLGVERPGGEIAFSGKPVLACGFAALLGRWTRNVAEPVLAGITGEDLATVYTGPGFVCRNRNGGLTTKVSEHAMGNAIDIVAFGLGDGRSLQIGSQMDDKASRALRAMRRSACGYFTTVLGPGANEAHASHFHFDHGQHGKTFNYRICE